MSKVLVIIDGSSFYHGSKRLCPEIHLTNFEYRKFVEELIGVKNPRILYPNDKSRDKNEKTFNPAFPIPTITTDR